MSEDPKKPTDSSATDLAGQAKKAVLVFQESLRKSIHESVVATNTFLGALEKKTGEISQPVYTTLKSVEHEGSNVASKAFQVYERRHEFGPHLVVGSGLTIGGLVALRRGRFSGAFSGALAAGLTYATVYEVIVLDDLLDLIPKK
jgi:hypothetical protein